MAGNQVVSVSLFELSKDHFVFYLSLFNDQVVQIRALSQLRLTLKMIVLTIFTGNKQQKKTITLSDHTHTLY